MVWRIVVAVLILVNAAQGCSCIRIDFREAVSRADVIFRGTVVDIHDVQRPLITDILQPRKRMAVLRVTRVWKGNVGETIDIPLTETVGNVACGSWERKLFEIGNDLLIFARRRETGEFTVGLCSHTGLVSESAKDLQELGEGKAP